MSRIVSTSSLNSDGLKMAPGTSFSFMASG
jgi:hypothetical protein